MKRLNIEFAVGMFLIAGLAAFFYLAVNLGDLSLWEDDNYSVSARFVNSSGLKEGGFVELAGVRVGKISSIELDADSYESVVWLSIDKTVELQEDTIASVRTAGIIGDKFIKLTPGGAEDYLVDGDEIIETESSLDIEELVSKYIFESGGGSEEE